MRSVACVLHCIVLAVIAVGIALFGWAWVMTRAPVFGWLVLYLAACGSSAVIALWLEGRSGEG